MFQRLSDGATCRYYVDDILCRSFNNGAAATFTTVRLTSPGISGSGSVWFDDVMIETPDASGNYFGDITVQPLSQTIPVGGSVTLSVTVADNGQPSLLAYQWFKGTTALAGKTASSFTINPAGSADSGNYRCEIYSLAGLGNGTACKKTSDTAALQVGAPPGDRTWSGEGGDDNWSTAANWSGGTPPNLFGDGLIFAGSTKLSPNMEDNYDVAKMDFSSGASSFSIGASPGAELTLSGNITVYADSLQTLNLPIALSGTRTVNAALGDIDIIGVISGSSYGLTKVGDHTLTLDGGSGNTFTGPLTVNAGTVVLNKSSGNALAGAVTHVIGDAFGTDTLRSDAPNQIADTALLDIRSGGVFELAAGVTETIKGFAVGSSSASTVAGVVNLGANAELTVVPNVAVGYSAVQITGTTGTKFIVNGAEVRWTPQNMVNTFEKLVIGTGGRLRIAHGANKWNGAETSLGAIPASFTQNQISITDGTLGLNGGFTPTDPLNVYIRLHENRGLTINGNATIETLANAEIPGKIIGSGKLIHNTAGDLKLTGPNEFSGGLSLSSSSLGVGSVTLGTASAAGTGTISFMANGSQLAVSTAGLVIANPIDISGFVDNQFGINQLGATGDFTISGEVNLGTTGSNPQIKVPGAATTITFSGRLWNTLGLEKTGPGKIVLTANNTYSGDTVISAGTLALSGSGSIPSAKISIANGATFDVSALSAYTVVGGRRLACSSSSGQGNVNGTLMFEYGGIAAFEAVGGATPSVGKIAVTGGLYAEGGEIVVNVTGTALGGGIYRLIDVSGYMQPEFSLTITGLGLLPGHTAVLEPATGGLDLRVISPCVAPSIASATGNQTVCPDTAVTMSVSAAGTAPFTYQWYKNGAAQSGATSSSLVVASATALDSGNYYCRVANACGFADSTPAALTVDPVPSIASSTGSQTVCAGTRVTISVSAPAGVYYYSWYKDGAPLGAASDTLTFLSVSTSDAGTYYCVVVNECHSASATTPAATLTVNPAASAPDKSVTRVPGGTAKVAVSMGAGETLSLGSTIHGTVSQSDGYILYAPTDDEDASFTYTIANANCSATGTITIYVTKPGGKATGIVYESGGVTVTFAGIPTIQYDIQKATTPSPAEGDWSTVDTQVAPADGIFTYTDTSAPPGSAFYRLKQH